MGWAIFAIVVPILSLAGVLYCKSAKKCCFEEEEKKEEIAASNQDGFTK